MDWNDNMQEIYEGEYENDYMNNWNRHGPSTDSIVGAHNNTLSPWNKENEGITTLYRCDVTDVKCLYIFDPAYKLEQNNHYDVGGAYADNFNGLYWVFFTTTTGPGRTFLMNLFVCQRQSGMFSLGISDSNTLTTSIHNSHEVKILGTDLHWQKFHSAQPDEVHYIKTFCFSEEDRQSLLKMVLVIPVSIIVNPKSILIKDVVQKIKSELEFGEKLLKDQEPDFILTSGEGKEFKVHKIVLAAHSSRLRDLIRAEDCHTLSLDITNYEVELLLQYLYTGVIKDILNQQLETLLTLADKLKLKNLTELVKHAMKFSIRSDNALAIAVVAEKYNFKDVQEIAFKYVAQHPEVLDSDAFTEIDNASVVKKLLRYIHVKTM